ncbi:unnamed protein product [Protopolystoma xenopodis]|uniref:Protein TSSC1 n=1 Tax=Protopolystoma xenopodis TaxID=117903 RepID=A0A3S5FFZ2_9PLAT|nr:unnamed protein product [Protopolystoma xenopodis]
MSVWSIRYHPTRDQLLLSAGSDSRVCLYALPSYSSDAIKHVFPPVTGPSITASTTNESDSVAAKCEPPDNHQNEHLKLRDGVISRLEQHEESVYAADWSPVDAWFFASVSYDGNLIVNRVPDEVKLNLLLSDDD